MPNEGPRQLDELTAAWQQAQEAFEQSERRYTNLVEHSLGLICTHDLDGRLLSINPAAAHSLGYEPEQGIGSSLVEFLAPETRHLFNDYLRRIREQRHDAGLMRVIARDGTARVWMYRNVLYDEPHSAPYVLGHAIDITERVAADRKLRESEQALRLAHADLDRRVQERTTALEQANAQLHVEIAERQRAEEQRARVLIDQRDALAFLGTVSDTLAPIVTVEKLVDKVPTIALPFAADWTMVCTQPEGATIRAEAGIHIDPERAPMLIRLAAELGDSALTDSVVARALATGHLTTVSGTADTVATSLAGSVDAAPLLESVGTRSVAVIPLLSDGPVRSALVLGAAAVDQFTGPGHMVVEDLARRIRLALVRIRLYQEVQEANRLKDEFLSTLSHELRTPLSVVFGWTRILQMRPLDPGTAQIIEVIERNARAQLRLIEDILDVSRIIAGKMTLSVEPLSIRQVLSATVDGARPAATAKGVRLELDFDSGLGIVRADAHRLEQAFANVLSNAVKFSRRDDTITVRLRSREGSAEIGVTDTGVGIHSDVLPFIFDRFRQADSSTTRSHGGLGLGLSIVRQIVELHGGTVTASSQGPGQGATFTIRLPLDAEVAAPSSSDAAAPELPAAAAPSTALDGRTILVVEDHDDAREMVSSIIAAAGAVAISATSAAEALRLFAERAPDLLVADLGLPGEDGYTLLQRIRAMDAPEARGLPAVALTAYARPADREHALAAGFQRYVTKPVDPQELVAVLSALLETAR
jgi:PAS domain S-box-containing protein